MTWCIALTVTTADRCREEALPGQNLCWVHRACVRLGSASEEQVRFGQRVAVPHRTSDAHEEAKRSEAAYHLTRVQRIYRSNRWIALRVDAIQNAMRAVCS